MVKHICMERFLKIDRTMQISRNYAQREKFEKNDYPLKVKEKSFEKENKIDA